MKTNLQNYINHVIFLLDMSGSMSKNREAVVKTVNKQIADLKQQSIDLGQETRISIYVFNTAVECLAYDMDVMRLPNISKYYNPNGFTALIDSTHQVIDDMRKTPEIHGDHAFLFIAWTDGAETENRQGGPALAKVINKLPDNWTLGINVPDYMCVAQAKKCGFPAGNIRLWDTTSKGFEESGNEFSRCATSFMQARARGIRSTKTLFTVDASNITKREVVRNLDELMPSQYDVLPVRKNDVEIRDYVESWLGSYTPGSGYYQLTKKEIVQYNKNICIRDSITGKVYYGSNARNMLGLPNKEIRVAPGEYGNFEIFIQSKSHNRHLVKGTDLLIIK